MPQHLPLLNAYLTETYFAPALATTCLSKMDAFKSPKGLKPMITHLLTVGSWQLTVTSELTADKISDNTSDDFGRSAELAACKTSWIEKVNLLKKPSYLWSLRPSPLLFGFCFVLQGEDWKKWFKYQFKFTLLPIFWNPLLGRTGLKLEEPQTNYSLTSDNCYWAGHRQDIEMQV